MAIQKQERPENYFRLQRIALKIHGISLAGNESNAYKIYSYVVFFTLVTYTMADCYSIYKFFDDLDVLATTLSLTITHILGILRMCVLYMYRVRIGKTLDNLEKGVFAPNEKRGGLIEEKWVRSCVSYTTVQTAIYWTGIALEWTFAVVQSILTRIRSSDYRDWEITLTRFSLFEVNTSTKFVVVWVYQTTCLTAFAIIITGIDLIIVGVLAHVCTQLKMLMNSTKTIGAKSRDAILISSVKNGNELFATKTNYNNNIIGQVVDYHEAIIDLTDTFEELFNILVLSMFLSNVLVLCFSMYHASLYPLASVQCIQDFIYVIVVILSILIYCYWGNQVTFESLKVAAACYDVDFVGLDLNVQKGLVMIMQRSQKPIILTAGKFAALSLQTFVSILKISYSYYMVLCETKKRSQM